LLQQSRTTAAKLVLCAHTVTVTVIAESQPLVSSVPHVSTSDATIEATGADHNICDIASTSVSKPLAEGEGADIATAPSAAEQLALGDPYVPGTLEDNADTIVGVFIEGGDNDNVGVSTSDDGNNTVAALTESNDNDIKGNRRINLKDASSLSNDFSDDGVGARKGHTQSSHKHAALSGLADAVHPTELPSIDNDGLENEDLSEQQSYPTSESSDDEEDDIVDPDVLRADWVPLRAIPEQLFRLALLQHLPKDLNLTADNIRSVHEIQGGFNFVRILQVGNGPSADRYVIKVPCTGTTSRWQDSDAYMLRNDAQTMSYISRHTGILCPEVVGFSDSLSNILGAPYIAMRANHGIQSTKVWFDRDEDGDDDLENACLPDKARMRIRVNFLRSLATQMAKLQTLEFDRAGTLDFSHDAENPIIGPTYHWKTVSEMANLSLNDLSTPASINCIPAYSTSKEYFTNALNIHWPHREGSEDNINNGRRRIMEFMLASPPFNKSKTVGDEKETFVLRHDDLDFQNVLCDEQGNVTAIIDWDKCRAAPRCVGFASLPGFLTKDWAPKFSTYGDIHMPWELNEYRNVYARAMLEATGPDGDGRYTIKSAIYEAVNAALYGGHYGGGVPQVVRRVKAELPGTRLMDDADILGHLGSDWAYGEMKVWEEVAKLVAPQSEVEVVDPWVFVDMEP
jgi:hypothetical protein